jgi:endonuclease YncB( thermonuclease family)
MKLPLWLGPLLVLCLIRTAAATADVTGDARVIDGDTIEVGGERVRLHGIDAPESRQRCGAGEVTWKCGEIATDVLVAAADGQVVRCEGSKRDRYGRLIAVCYAGEVNLNALMVRDGWALAFRRYAMDYVAEETAARAEQKGMWRGSFVAPWDWRRGERLARAH